MRNEEKKEDGTVIGFGCRDRDWMGKVSGNLGSSATNQNFEIILKFIFSEQFIRVNFFGCHSPLTNKSPAAPDPNKFYVLEC